VGVVWLDGLLGWADQVAAALLIPLACWIVLSGLDDLFILLAFLYRWAHQEPAPSPAQLAAVPERPVAVLVPCWKEDKVIGDMVDHNISALRYSRYHFFIGAYPNDEPTVNVIRELEQRHPNVHLCLVPHDGPTSKADCLNWVYQRMLLWEEERGQRFEIVVVHDAEDLIHSDELRWINYYIGSYDMVQMPVLPLPTPWYELTHGLYCDEFAEAHLKDLPARQFLGGFVPSCGVGTGYSREVLERIAEAESNRLFEPSCLTEDYENGLRVKRLGFRQLFLPVRFSEGIPIATREYFPRGFRDALRQRTRWTTGICLQTWQRYGWRVGLRQAYWFWRDRKRLLGDPASLLSNLVFLYGCLTWMAARLAGTTWGLASALQDPFAWQLLRLTLALMILQLSVRTASSAYVYGWKFALGAPLRLVYGNWVNTLSTGLALYTFGRAWLRNEPLRWVKTEHLYPSRAALIPHKRPLEEILLGSGYLTPEQLAFAQRTKPRGVRLAEHLVHAGLLTEEELYEVLSLQLGLALGRIEPHQVRKDVARCLPIHVIRKWNVLPVKIEAGQLYLASPDPPSEELHEALRRFTRLEIRVQLVTPINFRRLAEALL